MSGKPWFVYLLRCADNTLYAGISNDLPRRVSVHNHGKGAAKYTRARRPVALVWQQQVSDRGEASRCEHLLRTLSRAQKDQLVATAGRLPVPAGKVTVSHPTSPGDESGGTPSR